MARWLLTGAHYLNVVDNFWEQPEVDRLTGRQKKKKYPVPMHLDPRCAADWNNKPGAASNHITRGGNSFDEGFITVCYKGKGEAHDYIFKGDPTPDMEPIDDEAREISGKFKWSSPNQFFESGTEMSFAERMILTMQDDAKAASQASAASEGKLDRLADSIAAMAESNARLIEALTSRRV